MGDKLTEEGRRGREFFVLVEGAVAVRRGRRKLADLGPGDWFGEIAILTYKPRTATVTATSPVRLLVISDGRVPTSRRDDAADCAQGASDRGRTPRARRAQLTNAVAAARSSTTMPTCSIRWIVMRSTLATRRPQLQRPSVVIGWWERAAH